MNIVEYLDQKRPEMVESLAGLVRIPSVKSEPREGMPYGEDVARALAKALSIASSLGLKTRNVDNHMGVAEWGDGDETLGILVHLNVVPAGNGWNTEPFAPTIRNGIMYGRGVADNKGPAVASLYALAALRQSGIPMGKKVQVLMGCDAGDIGECIAYYKQHHKLPDIAFSPDGDYPVVNAEKAVLHANIKKNLRLKAGDVVSIGAGASPGAVPHTATAVVRCPMEMVRQAVPEIEQQTQTKIGLSRAKNGVRIDVAGTTAHASAPQDGNNALTGLLLLLSRLPLRGEVADSLRMFAKVFTHNDYYGFNSFVDCSDDASGRLTQNPAVIELGTRCITLCSDMRIPVTIDTDEVLVRLAASFPTCTVTKRHENKAHYVEEDAPLVQSLLKVYAEQTGNEAQCVSMGGATYARAIPGAVSFGCTFPGTNPRMHMADEQMSLADLSQNARIIAHAIKELCC